MELSQEQLTEVYAYIRKLCRAYVPYPDHEDVAIDAVIGLMVGVGSKQYQGVAHVKTYAHSITKNKINDWMREKYKMSNWQNNEKMKKEFVNAIGLPIHEKAYEVKSMYEKFMEGVTVCTPRQAEAVKLRMDYDKTAKEGAEDMGISERMFLTHVHNGIRKMLVRLFNEERSFNNNRPG